MADSSVKLTQQRGITSIAFRSFKSLSQFTVQLRQMNILVGPNNSGKSTVLDAFRLLAAAYRFATRRLPTQLRAMDGLPWGTGWIIPNSHYPISTENIHTNYGDDPATVTFHFGAHRRLRLVFGTSGNSRLYVESDDERINTTADFRRVFPATFAITPTLGPLAVEEVRVADDYFDSLGTGRQASRLFRNYWIRNAERFSRFRDLVQSTWPGVTIEEPKQLDKLEPRLTMFCSEGRFSREVAWAGYGFQIWLQLLTHLINVPAGGVFIVDEPEIYLHPDLHKKILGIARALPATVVLATHSVEIINCADPGEVLLVETGRQAARRLGDIDGLQEAISSLGSTQNMYLSRLARARRVLFVEGRERALLADLAEKLGHQMLSDGSITVVPLEGFDPAKVGAAQWAFGTVLGQQIDVGVLLDRDYRCDEEVSSVTAALADKTKFCRVLRRKEIENYLVVPRAIREAVVDRLRARAANTGAPEPPQPDIETLLAECADKLRADTQAQLVAKYMSFHTRRRLGPEERRQDPADLARVALAEFEKQWQDPVARLRLVGGKGLLSLLNQTLSERMKVTITNKQVLARLRREEIDEDINTLFSELVDMAG